MLGNNGLTLKDMTQGYATLANQGNKPTLHIVAQVQTANGTDLYNAPTSAEQTFEANNANLVTKALTGVVQRGTATEARATGHTIAGKSGTANDSNAASFIGYTPSMLTSVAMWYPDANGNPQQIPSFGRWTGGSDYPVHLFTEYMKQALADTPNETFPDATDNGKVGGPDGTWGTGAQKTWTRKQQTTVTPRAEENTQQTTPDQTEESQNSGQGSGDGGNAGNTPSPGGSDTNGGNTGSETGNDGSGGSTDGDTQQP